MQVGTRSQLQLAAVCNKQAAAVCSKQAAIVCSKQAATKSEKSNLHTEKAQASRLQQTMSRKVAATKSGKVAATKSRKTNLHTKNSQAATMPQLDAAAKPHACCLFAAIHCEKAFIFIRVAIFCGCAAWFIWDLVGNPEDRFSHNEAQIEVTTFLQCFRKTVLHNVDQNRLLLEEQSSMIRVCTICYSICIF